MRTPASALRSHLIAAVFFPLLSIVLTWPLTLRLGSHVPGVTADDNVAFLWNFWWMRHALSTGLTDFFHTSFLFAPRGVDLTLHAHTALSALLAATAFGRMSIIAALNATLLVHCALNGFAAYLLAFKTTSHRAASMVAGLFFAACPILTAHLFGHFNYYAAWGLPLFAFVFLEALERRSATLAAVSGAIWGVVIYLDYYYVVYLGGLAACIVGWRWLAVDITTRRTPRRIVDHLLLALVAVAAALALWIALTGGSIVEFGRVRVSLTTGLNVRTLGWVLFLSWLWRGRRPGIHAKVIRESVRQDVRVLVGTVAGFVAVGLPIFWAAFELWRNGGYSSQVYNWRSAPPGVDLLSPVAGNPFNWAIGSIVARVHTSLGMTEGPVWLGLAPLIVLVTTRKLWSRRSEAKLWIVVGAVFFVWALGPHLSIAGANSGLPLPQVLLRFVPIVSNARIPGYASVLVYLAAAVLLAIAVAASRIGQARWPIVALGALILVDFLAIPFPMVTLDKPDVYVHLAALPPGGVLEVPFGIRDGFGEEGWVDTRTLFYQSIHQKPLAGGYISRLPESVKTAYRESPVFGTFLRLSEGQDVTIDASNNATAAPRFLKSRDIRYVVVNTERAHPKVQAYVQSMSLRLAAADRTHQLFVID